jgi:predicted RNA-binding protein with PIN domain
MRSEWLIIDGYSLLHRDPELAPALRRDIDLARERLISKVASIHGALAPRTTLVFDGRTRSREVERFAGAVEIQFSQAGRTADTEIEQWVYRDRRPERLLVVSSDRAVLETVAGRGAATMSCGMFLDQFAREQQQTRRRKQKLNQRPSGPRLGDFFP